LFDDPKDIISMSSQTADGFMDKSTSKVIIEFRLSFFSQTKSSLLLLLLDGNLFMLRPADGRI
jgi:uncharacterized protein (DUF952 family)